MIGPDTVIEPGVSLRGRTRLGRGCRVEPYSSITDSTLADGVTVRQSSIVSNCEIGEGATVGPFAHLRDGAVIESGGAHRQLRGSEEINHRPGSQGSSPDVFG